MRGAGIAILLAVLVLAVTTLPTATATFNSDGPEVLAGTLTSTPNSELCRVIGDAVQSSNQLFFLYDSPQCGTQLFPTGREFLRMGSRGGHVAYTLASTPTRMDPFFVPYFEYIGTVGARGRAEMLAQVPRSPGTSTFVFHSGVICGAAVDFSVSTHSYSIDFTEEFHVRTRTGGLIREWVFSDRCYGRLFQQNAAVSSATSSFQGYSVASSNVNVYNFPLYCSTVQLNIYDSAGSGDGTQFDRFRGRSYNLPQTCLQGSCVIQDSTSANNYFRFLFDYTREDNRLDGFSVELRGDDVAGIAYRLSCVDPQTPLQTCSEIGANHHCLASCPSSDSSCAAARGTCTGSAVCATCAQGYEYDLPSRACVRSCGSGMYWTQVVTGTSGQTLGCFDGVRMAERNGPERVGGAE